MNKQASKQNEVSIEEAAAITAKVYRAGQIVYRQGYEFTVTEPQLHRLPEGGNFTHQYTFVGVCTADERNNSIRGTRYNGGTYGHGVKL